MAGAEPAAGSERSTATPVVTGQHSRLFGVETFY